MSACEEANQALIAAKHALGAYGSAEYSFGVEVGMEHALAELVALLESDKAEAEHTEGMLLAIEHLRAVSSE